MTTTTIDDNYGRVLDIEDAHEIALAEGQWRDQLS